MESNTKINHLEPGIYDNIPIDEYNALPYFRASGAKDMGVSIGYYWQNHINPNRTQKKTEATDFGTALHCYLLEPELFDKQYAIKPEGMNFTRKDGKDWRDEMQSKGLHIIKSETMETIKAVYESAAITGALAYLQGGKKEITFIWDEPTKYGDVRCKCRFDHLDDKYAIDVKSFSNGQNKPLDRCVALASANFKYHVSAVFYHRALVAHKKIVQMGYLFLDSSGTPHAELCIHASQKHNMNNEYWTVTHDYLDSKIAQHARMMQQFGKDQPWVETITPRVFSDNDFPQYMTEAMDDVRV